MNDETTDTIVVLVATYNGDKYLAEQLDSLLNQTYSNIRIYISDDGSTDDTFEILDKYVLKDSRIEYEKNRGLGSCKNFAQLLEKHKNSKYVMFCDQDDVWEKEKIEESYNQMLILEKKYGTEMPLLVYSGKKYVDENLQEMKIHQDKIGFDTKKLLCQCGIYGCTMMLNNSLAQIIKIPDRVCTHDHWIALTASVFGKIYNIDKDLMKYRQHSNNVTGGLGNHGLKNKIKNFNKTNLKIESDLSATLLFCKQYSNENPLVDNFASCFKKKGIFRILSLIRWGFSLNRPMATFRAYYVIWGLKYDE